MLTEHQIQDQIREYLQLRGFYVERNNSGMVKSETGGMVRLGVAGTPDLMAFRPSDDTRYVQLIYIEVKRPKMKATELQARRMQQLEMFGARCFIATSVEDVEKILKTL